MRTENRVVLITGDRNWDDREAYVLLDFLLGILWLYDFRVLVHGAARGIDSVADKMGRLVDGFGNAFDVRPYPADWNKYKKAAGAIRNREMHNTERPDVVIGIHKKLWQSKGTLDMMKYADQHGTPVYHLMDCAQLNDNFRDWLKDVLTASVEPAPVEP